MTWTTRPRSDLGTLSAILAGEGAAILLIHGVGLRAEAWNRQIDALAPDFRVVAPDMPGHGHSPVPGRALALAGYADAIAATLERPVLAVGHSMGAMIALDLALRYPDLIRGVAALNAVFRRDAAAGAAVRARADALDGATLPDPAPTLDRWFGAQPSPERDACRAWLSGVDPAGYRMAYRAFARADGPRAADLATLPCPALFMTGAQEPNSTPAMSRAMARLAPDASLSIVEGAAHMMPMTHADRVTDALRALALRALPRPRNHPA